METLAVALSTLGTICACVPSLLKGKNMKMILLLVFFANAFIAVSYSLTGAFNGAVSCALASIQTIINYFFERKNKPLPKFLLATYALSFIVVNIVAFKHITDIIALIAALIAVVMISVKNGRQYRLWSLINALLWIIYDLLTRSFGPLSTHIILLTTILFGMLVYDRKKNNT